MIRRPPRSPLFPYTPLSRSRQFGALYDRHFQQIYRFVYSRVREQTAAEDVTSEVFMKALRSEEHTSELQSQSNLVCRLLLEKKKTKKFTILLSAKPRHTHND